MWGNEESEYVIILGDLKLKWDTYRDNVTKKSEKIISRNSRKIELCVQIYLVIASTKCRHK